MKKIKRKILDQTIDFIKFGEHWYSNGYVNKEFAGLEKGLDYVIIGKNANNEWICTKSSGFCVNPNPIKSSATINEFTDWYTYENKPYFDLHLNNAGMFANKRYIYTAIVVKNMSADEVKNIKCQVTFDNEVVVKDYSVTSSNGYNDYRFDIPHGAKKILEVKFLNVLDENVNRRFVFPFHEVKWPWSDTNVKTLFNTKDNESRIVSNRMVAYNYITISKCGLSLPVGTDFINDFKSEKEKYGSTTFDQYWKTGKEDATGLDIEESVVWYSDRLLEWQNPSRIEKKSPISCDGFVVGSYQSYFYCVGNPDKGLNTLSGLGLTGLSEDYDTLTEIIFTPLTLVINNNIEEKTYMNKKNIKSNDAMVLNPKTDDIKIIKQEGNKITYDIGGAIYEANVERTNTDEIYVSDVKHIAGFNPNKQWRWFPANVLPYERGDLKDAETYVLNGWRYLDNADTITIAKSAFLGKSAMEKFEGSFKNLKNTYQMFNSCTNLTVDLSAHDFNNIETFYDMFKNVTKFTGNIKDNSFNNNKLSTIWTLGIKESYDFSVGNNCGNGDWESMSGGIATGSLSITSIGNNSFNTTRNSAGGNTYCIMGDNLIRIGDNVLTNVVFPSSAPVFKYTPKEIEYVGDNFLNKSNGYQNMFKDATKLRHVGKGLACGEVASGYIVCVSAFEGCTALEELPEGAFMSTNTGSNVKVVLQNTFKNCSSAKTPLIPYIEKLIAHYNEQGIGIVSTNGCFNGCTSAPDYEEAMNQYPAWF